MLPEIWEPDLMVVFVGSAVTEPSGTLGFRHLHPRDRFWELLDIGGLAPGRIITPQERKALADGHADGSLSDPVRSLFFQKKRSQLLKLGIGLADLNRREVVTGEREKSARPMEEDIEQFLVRSEKLTPKFLAFVTHPDIFVESFAGRFPNACDALGLQPFRIGSSEVWLLGSTGGANREARGIQEDAFFALGERIATLKGETP